MGSYRKGLTLSLGALVRTSVDLHTVTERPRTNLRRLCSEHHQPLKQRYYCPEGDHVVEWGQFVSGFETGEGWKIVNENDRPSFDSTKELELIPVPTRQLTDSTLPGDGFYYCQPSDHGSAKTWQILHDLLRKGDVTFVAKGALRQGARKLWRLDLFRDYLVLQEIVFPDVIKNTPEQVDEKIDRNTMTLARQYVETLTSSWDKIDTSDEVRAKFDEWVGSGEFVAASEAASRTEGPPPVEDLQAALAAAVENAKKNR